MTRNTSVYGKPAILGGAPAVLTPYEPDWPKITDREISAVVGLMKQGILSIYDRSGIIAELEEAFASYHKVRYALTHNAGTSALHAAFFAIGIGPGDEVLAPTYTFLATVIPILQCNAVPVLCDMDTETLVINPQSIRQNITSQSRAIVVTHMWGNPVDMSAILEIAQENNLAVIEDCSHAHGAIYKGQKVGTIGDIGAFSLQTHKPLVAGEGGMFITNNQDYYERATLLGHFGERAEQCIELPHNQTFMGTGFGHKYRMHPLAAAIAHAQLTDLDKWNDLRRQNMDYMTARLQGVPGVRTPSTYPDTERIYYGYKLIYEPDELSKMPINLYMEALRAEGVKVKRPDSGPLHLQPLFQAGINKLYHHNCPWGCPFSKREVAYQKGDLPDSEQVFERLLSLPAFTDPAEELIDQYVLAFTKVATSAADIIAEKSAFHRSADAHE